MKRFYALIAVALLLLGVTSSAGVFNIPSGTATAGMIISDSGSGGGGTISYGTFAIASGSDATPTADLPTSTAAGDMIVVVVNSDSDVTLDGSTDGLTTIQELDSGTTPSVSTGLYWKAITSADVTRGDISVTAGGASAWSMVVARFTKTGGTWNLEDSDLDDSWSASLSIPAVTSTGGLIVTAWGSDDAEDDTSIDTAPADMTEIDHAYNGSSGCGMWYQLVTSGNYAKSITFTGGNEAGFSAAFNLN